MSVLTSTSSTAERKKDPGTLKEIKKQNKLLTYFYIVAFSLTLATIQTVSTMMYTYLITK